jgi:hypothetical protein
MGSVAASSTHGLREVVADRGQRAEQLLRKLLIGFRALHALDEGLQDALQLQGDLVAVEATGGQRLAQVMMHEMAPW